MNHHTTADFWECYGQLPRPCDAWLMPNYELLRADPRHPSLHFKRVGRLWSVRVGIGYRALAVNDDDGPVWFWIDSHAEYDRIVRGS